MSQRLVNFSAGPAILPLPVLEEAQRHLVSLPGAGMSVLEISHRSATFDAILEEAEANLRRLLAVPESHRILFLQGGASLQFSMVPMNLLRGNAGGSADYLLTGSWGVKAAKEAEREGRVRRVFDGTADGFVRSPLAGELDFDPQAAYVHLTTNETIQGVQFPALPATGDVPLVCDASSDFLSRPLPASGYHLLYAGAQKNAGPAGVTVVIVHQELLERRAEGLPSMLDYRLQAAKGSTYNTPPVFAIYLVMLVSRWLLDTVGGLEAMERQNRRKAERLYQVIDDSDGFYRGHAVPASRSLMNVTWRLPSEELERSFLARAAEAGLVGLKGHRSVGGLRASIYNAMPPSGVEALAELMTGFQLAHG